MRGVRARERPRSRYFRHSRNAVRERTDAKRKGYGRIVKEPNGLADAPVLRTEEDERPAPPPLR